jgi:hypothetical protein
MLVFLLTSVRYFQITKACLMNATFTNSLASYYDLRYFYFDNQNIGHPTCGYVFQIMMSLLRQRPDVELYGQEWYSVVRKCRNPVVQGFLSEQICLSAIATHGLTAFDPELGPMNTTIFEREPVWDCLLQSGETHGLFIPQPFSFKAIDGAILQVDHRKKVIYLYPIQITLSTKERDSAEVFYNDISKDWIWPLRAKKYKVHSIFIYIDRKAPNVSNRRTLRSMLSGSKYSKSKGDGHDVVHIGLQQVDSELASAIAHQAK